MPVLLLQDDVYKNGGAYDRDGFKAALGAAVGQATTGKHINFAVTQDAKARLVVYEGEVAFTDMVVSSESVCACLLPPSDYPAGANPACTATPAARTLLLQPMVLLLRSLRRRST